MSTTFLGEVGKEYEVLEKRWLGAYVYYTLPKTDGYREGDRYIKYRGTSTYLFYTLNPGDRIKVKSIERRVEIGYLTYKSYEVVYGQVVKKDGIDLTKSTDPPKYYYFWIIYEGNINVRLIDKPEEPPSDTPTEVKDGLIEVKPGKTLVLNIKAKPKIINIWLQFEIWDKVEKKFKSLCEGIAVDIMDSNTLSDDVIFTGKIEKEGRVHFELSEEIFRKNEPEPDIYFLVKTGSIEYAGWTLPEKWSTKGWKTKDDKKGYYENYQCEDLGSQFSPLVFRIGLDFHFKIEYVNEKDKDKDKGNKYYAPKGIFCSISNNSMQTDEKGELHGVLFNINPDDDIQFETNFEIEDSTIMLKKAKVVIDTAKDSVSIYGTTSIGEQNTPITIPLKEDQAAALYILKIHRELSTFLYIITNGTWEGFDDLKFFLKSKLKLPLSIIGKELRSYSWPIGEVIMISDTKWERSTIIHEISHQIMWKEADYSSYGIAYEATYFELVGHLLLEHESNLLLNPEHALIEGWALFFQALFPNTPSSCIKKYALDKIYDKKKNEVSLGPPPKNRGESVEGAFANGLLTIFEELVGTPTVPAKIPIQESTNGDIMKTKGNEWIDNKDIKKRFSSFIWEPLKKFKSDRDNNPKTTKMIEYIRDLNIDAWHKVLERLQQFNMAMYDLIYGYCEPPKGKAGEYCSITISGSNFLSISTTVEVGGNRAEEVNVASHNCIKAIVKLPVDKGLVDIKVTTAYSYLLVKGCFEIVE